MTKDARPVPYLMGLDIFAQRAGLHPDLIARLVALGLVEAERDPLGRLWFAPSAVAALERVRREHADRCLPGPDDQPPPP